jgi:hypothetical protein
LSSKGLSLSLDAEAIQRVATAAERVPGPRLFPWPMRGRLDGMVSFSTYAEWQDFFLQLDLTQGVPAIVTAKYDRALKLHLLSWIDFDIIKAGEIAALTTLELALKNRYGDKVVKDRHGNISFNRLLRYMVDRDDLTDEKLKICRRCGLGSVTTRLTGEIRPILADIRNDLAHGYPFDGLPQSGLLEVVRDLIEYAYRDMIVEHPALHP